MNSSALFTCYLLYRKGEPVPYKAFSDFQTAPGSKRPHCPLEIMLSLSHLRGLYCHCIPLCSHRITIPRKREEFAVRQG